MKEETSIKAHLKYTKEITNKITLIDWFSNYRGRSSSYAIRKFAQKLFTALEAHANDNLKLAKVQQALVQQESKLNNRLKQRCWCNLRPKLFSYGGGTGGEAMEAKMLFLCSD